MSGPLERPQLYSIVFIKIYYTSVMWFHCTTTRWSQKLRNVYTVNISLASGNIPSCAIGHECPPIYPGMGPAFRQVFIIYRIELNHNSDLM